jgi:squalene-hopene/tetraprenyl-beta-curcumene cyclase
MHRALPVLVLVAGLLPATFVPVLGADWSPQRAAQYLDARQKAWFAWKPAASPEGPCVSCHTGMTYLLARPALRQALGETQPTMFEQGLLDRLRANVGAKPEGALQGVETVFAALFLARHDAGKTVSSETRRAFDQLWALQLDEGATKGAWQWYPVNLNPYEHSRADFFGASLAALAIGTLPGEYAETPQLHEHLSALTTYFEAGADVPRPLHDRLARLWASSKLRSVLPDHSRKALIEETFGKQQADGGWTIESLGPWTPHPDAPPSHGSNGFATAYATYVLGQAGVAPSHPGMSRALEWLKSHQDHDSGAWQADSMNKRYPDDSMQVLFMQDAATAFASLALLEAGQLK